MASYNFSSLMDLLKLHLSQKPKLVDSYVTEMFGELYFKECPSSSSSLHSLFPPLMPPPPSSSSAASLANPNLQIKIENLNGDANHEIKSTDKNPMAENKCNKCSFTGEERLFPPPISCLKSSKITGRPFVYFTFDETTDNKFVRDEIKILPHDVLCGSRENGRLKLNFACYEAENEGDEEEEEEETEEEKETSEEVNCSCVTSFDE